VGKVRILNREGDSEIQWNKEDPASLEAAKVIVEDLQKQGNAAFAKKNGETALVRQFDPDAEEILIVKPLVGG